MYDMITHTTHPSGNTRNISITRFCARTLFMATGRRDLRRIGCRSIVADILMAKLQAPGWVKLKSVQCRFEFDCVDDDAAFAIDRRRGDDLFGR